MSTFEEERPRPTWAPAPVSNLTACPSCSSRAIFAVEVQGVYDGGLFWACDHCGHRWHRWPPSHHLHALAAQYVEGGRDPWTNTRW